MSEQGATTQPRDTGRFIAGTHYSPATQFKAGQRPSPATEFQPGQEAHNRLPIGTVRVRRETNTGLLRAWIKVAEPNAWQKRAVLVWEKANGPLKRGLVVHHRDHDSLNDEISNLAALTRKQHAQEHRNDLHAWRNPL